MKRGFTLAELLIALALTALAIAIMSEGVRRTIDFQSRLETVRQDRETTIAISAALRSRLEHLVPAMAQADLETEAPSALFSGTADRLAFIAADPGYPSRAGLYEYRLTLMAGAAEENDAATPQLVLRRRPITELTDFGQASGPAFQRWELPLTGELAFRYGSAPDRLQSAWSATGSYPAYVALVSGDDEQPVMMTALPRLRPDDGNEPDGDTTP